jgi:hypothetical protein
MYVADFAFVGVASVAWTELDKNMDKTDYKLEQEPNMQPVEAVYSHMVVVVLDS